MSRLKESFPPAFFVPLLEVFVISMLTIGLVGGVASGKSAAAHMLAAQIPRAVRIDADQLGHEVLMVPAVKDVLVARWGKSILNENDQINRSAVARLVFPAGQEQELRFLEEQTHPLIRQRIRLMKQEAELAGVQLVIVDAALLLETNWADLCDVIVFVDTPQEIRLQRALTRRGWTPEEFARREAAQWPVEKKKAAAHEILPNAGDEADLDAACRHLWQRVKARS